MTKILILGGGFGGIRTALDLKKKLDKDTEITLIDKKSFHLFIPSLYEVASAYGVKKDPFAVRLKKTICIPYSDIFSAKGGPASGRGNINFIQAEISSIDVGNKKVATGGGEILNYDYLVIALGSKAADFGVPGVKEYAFQFKNLEDSLLLNQKINELAKEVAAGQRERPIKITVVGAGFTGIEVAAEFACCVKKLTKACLKGKCERIILLEAGPKILPHISDDERNIILKRLTRLGIEVMENAMAEEVRGDYIKLKSGKYLDTDMVIWTTGLSPLSLLEATPSLPLTNRKKIKVNSALQVIELSGVFAVGDNVEFLDTKTDKPVPALAYVAADQGKIAAKNILRLINNK